MSKGMHEFCRLQLSIARHEAAKNGVKIPPHITALSDGNSQFFMEAKDTAGEWVSACCGYQARAKFIHHMIDAAKQPRHALDEQERQRLFTIAQSLESLCSRESISDIDLLHASVNVLDASAIVSGLDSSAQSDDVVQRCKAAIDCISQRWPENDFGDKAKWTN